MNPCRCGYFGDEDRQCNKVPKCADEYQQKISGPMLDRFDLVIPVQALKPEELQAERNEESSQSILQRVENARSRQHERYNSQVMINAYVDGEMLDKAVRTNAEVDALLHQAINRYNLSARGYHRLLRVSRTIADLESHENISSKHVLEALNYRLDILRK
jgi:magnesium chelatase family protein